MWTKLIYEVRIAFGFASLIPLLILPIYALLEVVGQPFRKTPVNIEVILPLIGGLCAAHLMSIEREERFDELRRTYSEPAWYIPLLRTSGVLIAISACLLLSILILLLHYPLSSILEASLPAFAPTLYLIGLALVTNNITGNYWFSAALIGLYWFLEYQSRGQLTRHFYLFDYTFPIDFINYHVNRSLLFAMALLCFSLNFAYSIWRKHGNG